MSGKQTLYSRGNELGNFGASPDHRGEARVRRVFQLSVSCLEVYHEETGSWLVHKQIPGTVDRNIFINRADSGCISSRAGTVYSVGEEVIALDWTLLSLTVVTKLPRSAKAEGCTAISLDSDNFGFFFLSGDFYSLSKDR